MCRRLEESTKTSGELIVISCGKLTQPVHLEDLCRHVYQISKFCREKFKYLTVSWIRLRNVICFINISKNTFQRATGFLHDALLT
jgi:hypothetical protein